MDKKILLLLFLVSGFAFSQTTVTLQDQCNCEVLSGTAVTSPGTTTPSGADTGDIYVNTNTGVIYFWDGDSWELTSSDDQQLQNFSFNSGTNILSLDIEDGNTVNVDLSSLSGTGTDDQLISLAGNILTLEDGGTVDLSPYLDNTDDQIITAFSINASNILTLTLENGNTQTVDLSGLVGTDDQLISLAGNILTLENGGNVDLTSYLDNTDDQIITAFSIDAGNILTLTLEDGNTQTVDLSGLVGTDDQTAAEVTYDNTVSGLTATDVQAAIDEINGLAGTVALVDNADGTYTFTDAGGNVTTISDTSISTMVDNLDGTYTYTDETGATQLIDTNASSNPYDNTVSGLTATDVQAAIDEINAAAGTVALVDNADGTYTFTDAGGNVTTISDTSISTMVDNLDGTYTYTDETGATQLIDTNASSNPYDNTVSGLTATDVQAAIDEINAAAGTVALVDNADGTYTFTDAGGNVTTISDTSISTLVDNLDGTYTYTDETGTTQLIDTNASSNPYDNTVSGLTATDVQAAIDEINALAGTVALVDNLDGTYDFTDAAGNTTTISDTSISTLVDNLDGTYTYTDETGTTQLIDTNASSNPYDNTASGLTAIDVQAALDELAAGSTDDQTISTDGTAGNISIEDGNTIAININDADADATNEFNTGISFDGTNLTVTDAGGNQVVDISGVSTDDQDLTGASLSGANILQIDIENGGSTTVDLSALDDPGTDDQTAAEVTYDNIVSGLTAIDVQAALDELAAGSTDDQNISGSGLAGTDLTIGIENGTNEVVDLSSLVESVIAGTGAITVTDDGNGNYTVNSTDPDEDLTNELTLLGNGAPVVVPSNAGVTYVDTVAGQLYVWDGAVWNVVGGNASPDLDGDPANELNTAFAVNAGNLEITDNGGTLTVPLASLGTDDQTAAEVTYDNIVSGLTAIDVQAALDELAAGSTDDQTISTDGTAGNISIEDGNTIAININDADADATNEFNTGISFDGTNLTVTDAGGNQVVDISGVSTDDQDLTGASLSGANILQIDIENGGSTTVDLSALDDPGTDDQTAAEVTYDNIVSGLTAIDVQAALDELAAGSTDDQTISTDGTAGNISIEDGNTIAININDADADATNEYNTGISFDGSNLTVTDAGGNQVVDISGVSTDDQNISGSGLAGTDLTIGIENGTNEIVDLSSLVETVVAGTGAITVTDDGNGNYTVNSTDPDEDLTNELTLIGAGAPAVVPSNSGVTYVDSVAGQLYIWDGAVWSAVGGNASPDLDGDPTNEHNTSFAVNAGNLEITDGGGTLTVPLASLGTDDQTISTDGTAGNISIEDGNTIAININDADADATNEFNTGISFDGTNLTVTDAGGNQVVDISGVSTDDQNIESLAVDAGTNILTVGIENGTSQTVDLSHLDDTGTDDQTAAEVTYDNTTSGLTATEVQAALDEVAAGSTDDQNISGSGLAGNILTIGIENGTNETVDLSALVGTDDQNLSLAANTLSIEDGNNVDLSPYLDNTDDQNISGSGLAGNILTIGIENGTNETVDLSALVGTDDQTAAEVSYDNTTSGLTATEVQAAIDEVAAGSTDDQNISGSGLAGNILTIGIENGTNETVDLSTLVGTDDQNIESLAVDAGTNILTVGIEDGVSQTVDLSHLDDAGTDDQTISTDGSAGNISIEDGNTIAINVNDADADATNEYNTGLGTNAGALEVTDAGGTLSTTLISTDANNDIASGSDGALYLNVASVTISETITNLVDNANGTLTYTNENGVPQTVSKADITDNADGTYTFTNNDGSDVILDTNAGSNPYDNTISGLTATNVKAALDELASGSTDDQNITGSGLAGNILTIGIENGTNETVDLSALVGTDDQIASEVNITDAGGNFVSTEVEGALAELAAGSTDDQNIAGSGLAGNILTIGIENGTNETVDLSALVGTDDQNIESLAVDAGTNILTVGIEDGTSQTVDLSHLDDAGTDDQIASEVNITDAGGNFVSTEVEGALAELAAGSTDDQNIAGSGLAGNILTIGIENGTNETVDLSALVGTDDQNIESLAVDAGTNILTVGIEDGTSQTVDLSHLDDAGTDDQNITGSGLAGNILTIGIENGTNETVDLSALVGTDDQIASEVNITDAGGNFVSTEVEGALAELAAGSTDDQNIAGSGLAGNILTIGIENGTNETVDLSALVGTDDQNIESLAVDAGTNILTVGIEDGTSQTVDLSHLDDAGTDDQNITGSGLAGNILTIGIENGTNETVDLSALVGTDDQIASEVNITDAGGNFVSTEVEGALAELAAGSTDDQNIAGSGLAGNILTIGIENGTNETVDLSALVGTDDQNIESLAVDAGTNILTVGIEDGTSQTVDLSHLDDAGTDDQIASEVNITDAGGNFVSTEVEGALAELAAGSTDDQNIAGSGLAGNILTIGIENGTNETVDLSALVGTDDQNIESLAVDAGTNILTVGIEDGTSQTVDLSHLDDAGTDDQIASEVNITDAGGNFVSTEVEGALAELAAGSTDDQNIAGSGLAGNILTIGIENGTNETVDLSALVGTDDQNIESLAVDAGTNILTVGIEDGTSQTVDLSHLDDAGTDDQIASEVNITDAGGNFVSTEVEGALAELAAGSTDDQNIAGSGLAGNILTIGIENGTNETVDLSALVGTDDQNIESLAVDAGTNILTVGIEDGTSQTVDLSHLDDAGTDDQNITGSGLAGNILTIGIENGTNETVDLSALVGTDDQIASEVNITDAGGNFVSTEVEGALAELAAGSTDDQNIAGSGLAGNILTIGIENGTNETVDLSALVGTDDQNIESLAVDAGTNILTVGIEDGTSQTVDLSHLDDAGTDDQYDDEVLLRTPIDVDEGGVGSPTNETTVEEVIQAIAPITSKAARIFYPPSIAVDASTNGSFSIDLYAQYTAQFGTPTVASAGAPAAVPTYGATELYYYVTYADPTVFNTATMAIDGNGVLSYDIIGQPSDYNSLINVVFVVK